MGQAVVDLPDPLDAPPPTSLSGTDDLLAQLAGDEIDRLLAEADADQAPAPPPPPAPPPAPAPPLAAAPPLTAAPPQEPRPAAPQASAPIPSAVAARLRTDAPTVAGAPSYPNPGSVAPVPAGPQAPADDDLDALLNQLNSGVRAPMVAELEAATALPAGGESDPAATPKTLTEQVPEVLAQFGAAVVPPSDVIPSPDVPAAAAAEGLMSPAERDALRIGDLAAEADAADQQDAAAALATASVDGAAQAPSAKPPGKLAAPAIRLLEWVNAPLSFVPDAARDTLGRVAVLTLVNSAAVLIYVLFIRR